MDVAALTRTCLLLFAVCSPLHGQSVVIGSPRVTVAAPGDDVILPCHLEPPANVEGLTVEWAKPDLKPDPSDPLSRVEYVHLYRNRGEVVDMKLASYVRRTQLFADGLRRGNISLKILNVTLADTGRYRCFIPKLNSPVRDAVVRLVVDPDVTQTSSTETPPDPGHPQTSEPEDESNADAGDRHHLNIWIPVVLFCVLLLGAVAVCCYKLRRKKHKEYGAVESKAAPA